MELHALSGWDHDHWSRNTHYERRVYSSDGQSYHYEKTAPKYDLSFLLDKLRDLDVTLQCKPKGVARYRVTAWGLQPSIDIALWDDSPVEALARLAIELFKQGILTRSGDAG